jgi:hypothetical protein
MAFDPQDIPSANYVSMNMRMLWAGFGLGKAFTGEQGLSNLVAAQDKFAI